MSVAKGFRLSDNSTAKLDWNYVTKPDGTKSIIEEVNDVKADIEELQDEIADVDALVGTGVIE